MPPRNPNAVQLDFPQLVADIIEQLNLTGTVGLLDFSPEVVPVYLAAARSGVFNIAEQPTFLSAGIFSNQQIAAAANTVLLDTGQLAAGVVDVKAGQTNIGDTNSGIVSLQHRNAANAATLAEWFSPRINATPHGDVLPLTMSLTLATNERLRWILDATAMSGGSRSCSYIMISPRPVP